MVVSVGDMNDLGAKTSGGYCNESKRILGSFDPIYYDDIITKLNLQTREEYERASKYPQKQKKYKTNMYCIVEKRGGEYF
jgi:hypothetical protein